jgi:hypothetical protein
MPETPERAPIANAPLSVLLVALGPEVVASEVVELWAAYLDSLHREYQLLLVYDNRGQSGDLSELAARLPHLALLPQPEVDGFGTILCVVLDAARHPLFVYAECSSAYQPADLNAMLEIIDEVDVVSGDRTGRPGQLRHSWGEWAFQWFVRIVFGVRLRDSSCPFKLFRRSIFGRIPIQSSGSFAHVEILAKANFLGCVMTEIPISFRPSAPTAPGRSARQRKWTEAWRILRHPDFGPAALPCPSSSADPSEKTV